MGFIRQNKNAEKFSSCAQQCFQVQCPYQISYTQTIRVYQLVIFYHCVLFRINIMLRKQQARNKKFMKKGEGNDEQFEKKNHT